MRVRGEKKDIKKEEKKPSHTCPFQGKYTLSSQSFVPLAECNGQTSATRGHIVGLMNLKLKKLRDLAGHTSNRANLVSFKSSGSVCPKNCHVPDSFWKDPFYMKQMQMGNTVTKIARSCRPEAWLNVGQDCSISIQ